MVIVARPTFITSQAIMLMRPYHTTRNVFYSIGQTALPEQSWTIMNNPKSTWYLSIQRRFFMALI